MARRLHNNINFEKDMAKFVQSLNELVKEPRQKRRIYQSVMRKPAKPLVDKMRGFVSNRSGKLRKSIAIRNMNKSKNPGLFIGPQVNSRRANFAGNWAWVAYGTKERRIDSARTKPETRKRMVTRNGKRGVYVRINGVPAFVWRTGKMEADNYAKKTLDQSRGIIARTRDVVQKRMSAQYDKVLIRKGLKSRV